MTMFGKSETFPGKACRAGAWQLTFMGKLKDSLCNKNTGGHSYIQARTCKSGQFYDAKQQTVLGWKVKKRDKTG